MTLFTQDGNVFDNLYVEVPVESCSVLKRLTIRNFGIIDALDWAPTGGLNVLTGETGAGKSLVLDALDVLRGRRVGQEVVRHGASDASIEAVVAASANMSFQDDGSHHSDVPRDVAIRRVVERNGRGAVTIDGRPVPVKTLRDVASRLFELLGPNQQFSLLEPREQLLLVDAHCGSERLREEFCSLAEEVREVRRRLSAASTDEREVARRRDRLQFELAEIRGADLAEGEDEELAEEDARLTHMDRLRSSTGLAADSLNGGGQDIPSGMDRIGDALRELRDAASVDARLASIVAAVESALYQLEDTSRELDTYRDTLEYDAARHEQVQARIDQIDALKRKYGATIEAILEYADRAEAEIGGLITSDEQREGLTSRETELLERLASVGEQLSERRRAGSSELSAAVENELRELNMDGTGFIVSFSYVEGDDLVLSNGETSGFTSDGIDDVEFLIRPNPGEPFVPLSRTASTGETSRLMLAMRCALSRSGDVPVVVFDEIDIGVGGRSGEVIGRKLASLAQDHQVMCITHLPQVAAYGDSQYVIAKHVENSRTFVTLSQVEADAREAELSAMLGSLGEPSLFGAKELLSRAAAWKNEHT